MGKYLVAISTSLCSSGEKDLSQSSPSHVPKLKARRKQLHILYLLNDLLHQTKYHYESPSAYPNLTTSFQPFLGPLFQAASAYDPTIYTKQRLRIGDILQEWEKHGYFPLPQIHSLQEAVVIAGNKESTSGATETLQQNENRILQNKPKHDTPYLMPANHGDPYAPYYDLPAGNLMPHILPNSATSINPHLVKALQFTPGPADETLVIALKDFMKSVDALYEQNSETDEGISVDIDELGQPLIRDEFTGEIVGAEAYYGWSKAFCEKMKNRRSGKTAPKSRGRSDSLGRSSSPHKRRRYSSSEVSRSPSRTRSDLKFQRRGPQNRTGRDSYSRSRSRSRTRSLSSGRRYHRTSRSRSRSRSRSYSPPVYVSSDQQQPSIPATYSQSQARFSVQAASPPVPPPFSGPFSQSIPLGPGGMPIPPPPPPNYTGLWPPPPPPVGSKVGIYQLPAFVPPPPPSLPLNNYGDQAPPIPIGYPSQGTAVGTGWSDQEQRGQYTGSGGRGAGYGRSPPQGQRGGQHGGRGKGGRGGWRG